MKKIKSFKSVKDFSLNGLGLSEYETWLISFKNKLKKMIVVERKKQNLSQEELAQMLGTTQSVVSRIESGLSKNITIDYLLKIITILGLPPEKAMKSAS